MKLQFILRALSAFSLIVCLLTVPMTGLAAAGKKGDKNYKEGLKHETAQRWDKAAEEFALAVAAAPGNTEYQLHYRRALFNASQMMMARGRTLSEQKDFVGAYNAFRQAYGYDPVNELAKSEMERMLRLQKDTEDPNAPNKPKESPKAQPAGVKLVPTAYRTDGADPQQQQQDAPQLEQLRDIRYTKVDLKTVIKDLAQALDLNVIFDTETFRQPRDVTIELKNVTTAQALDYIFMQESLFFQKIGKRAVLVASQNRRQNFQQLVLRTFYLANAKPEDVQKVLQQAIPPQPGRAPLQPITDPATNSITVRDTSENIKIISNLIRSLDKDRAEVVMDVNIYEVTKDDLLQFGNQVGSIDAGSVSSFGGVNSGAVGIGQNAQVFGRGAAGNAAGTAASLFNRAIAAGFLIPSSNITAFQSKNNSKLLASTQVHAFNNEESQARIGQRVPVQTAQTYPFTNAAVGGQTGGAFGGGGFPVINYEQVGLTLKFTPIVFPNQDVQVKMSIESKDVVNASLTPTFTERSISGTARIQNNRTLLLASVAQDNQSDGRAGLPLVGLVPVLGRLFTSPRKSGRQVDIVIAVTPRVLRAPSILPEDEQEQSTGSIAVPTNSSLADMIQREDQEDRLASARRLTNTAVVQLPDAPVEAANAPATAPGYVSTPTASNTGNAVSSNAATTAAKSATAVNSATVSTPPVVSPEIMPRPINSSAIKTLDITATSDRVDGKAENSQPSEQPIARPQADAPIINVPTEPLPKAQPEKNTLTPNVQSAPVQNAPTSNVPMQQIKYTPNPIKIAPKTAAPDVAAPSTANLRIESLGNMKVGEKRRVAIFLKSPASFRMAILSLSFKANQIAVRNVTYGDVFVSGLAQTAAPASVFGGQLILSLPVKQRQAPKNAGVLAYLEVEALASGKPALQIENTGSRMIGDAGDELLLNVNN